MNTFYILIPILILIIFLLSYNVEGFYSSSTTRDNIKLSDNWCNCDKTCKLANVSSDGKASGTSAIQNPNDTCDINFDFIEDLEPTGDRLQDLKNYCDGCLDILRNRCRHSPMATGVHDPPTNLDKWCRNAGGRPRTGPNVVDRCGVSPPRSVDKTLDMWVEQLQSGFGLSRQLPCPKNQNIWQRWKRGGRFKPSGPLGSDIRRGLYDDID